MKAAVFFERDGVLNLPEIRNGRQQPPLCMEQLRVNREAIPVLAKLKAAGFVLVATTNQPGVQQGLISRSELQRMHTILMHQLGLDDIFTCPYQDSQHPCYKPQPGMLLEAAFKWTVDLNRSYVISDKHADAKAAQVVGATSIMIQSAWIGEDHHDFVVPDLATAAAKVLEFNRMSRRREWAIA